MYLRCYKETKLEKGLFYISIVTLVLFTLFWLWAVVNFIREKERIATLLASTFFAVSFITTLYIFLFGSLWLYTIVVSLLALVFFLIVFPFKTPQNITDTHSGFRFDERLTMFSRSELEKGTKRYTLFYKTYPNLERKDNMFRSLPGLLSYGALFYDKEAFGRAIANFEAVKAYYPLVDKPVYVKRQAINSEEVTVRLKKFAKSMGALEVGVCRVLPQHMYSYRGRGNYYGKPVSVKYKYAIAFTVEMDYDMVMAAPRASIVVESSRQYLNSAKIATELAETIRDMGYEARAHIDGDYELICPLVARDAGLGEIGRMGLLMTPDKGPRVRIAVVTTNLELKTDPYTKNHALLDFCRMCRICSINCPSVSIPFDDPEYINGALRWKIDAERCYTYWCKVGTDCGRCMAVCPYSHPDNLFHKLIRIGIQKSRAFRYMAKWGNDYFYGTVIKPRPFKWPST